MPLDALYTAFLHIHPTSAMLLPGNSNAFAPQLQCFCSSISMLLQTGVFAMVEQGMRNREIRGAQ
jgi:hypothetical protein